jgi:hypothetical protein
MIGMRRCLRPLAAVAALWALPACGATTIDHTPEGNILDADTQSLEGGLGHWQAWYSVDVSRATDGAQRGHGSLRIAVTDPFGWGAQLDNWPGFPAAPGDHRAELWARAVSGSGLELKVSVHWKTESGDDLHSEELRAPLGGAWRKLERDLLAPSGTKRVTLELTGGEGDPGDALEVDEIFLLGQAP